MGRCSRLTIVAALEIRHFATFNFPFILVNFAWVVPHHRVRSIPEKKS